jgi:hypothetical protein
VHPTAGARAGCAILPVRTPGAPHCRCARRVCNTAGACTGCFIELDQFAGCATHTWIAVPGYRTGWHLGAPTHFWPVLSAPAPCRTCSSMPLSAPGATYLAGPTRDHEGEWTIRSAPLAPRRSTGWCWLPWGVNTQHNFWQRWEDALARQPTIHPIAIPAPTAWCGVQTAPRSDVRWCQRPGAVSPHWALPVRARAGVRHTAGVCTGCGVACKLYLAPVCAGASALVVRTEEVTPHWGLKSRLLAIKWHR